MTRNSNKPLYNALQLKNQHGRDELATLATASNSPRLIRNDLVPKLALIECPPVDHELLEGIPRPQVIRFQMMAPITAPNTALGSTTVGAIMPVPSVLATCKPKNRNAMKLKNAAHPTA
jgi:hypothetical protein